MRTLFQFAKQHCANVDNGGCVHWGRCLLSEGKACSYFKTSVWPICNPEYRYATETKHFPALRDEFSLLYGRVQTGQVRYCECGEPLKKRQRLCDACRKKARKESYRLQKQKQRKNAG